MSFKYRAENVGSLLRPPELLDARENTDVSPAELKALEDHHILEALKHQQKVGLKIYTDGELRRTGFMGGFFSSVAGLGAGGIDRKWKTGSTGTEGRGAQLPWIVVDRIRAKQRMTKNEVDFLKKHWSGDIKITLPTPNQFPAICYKKGTSDKVYSTYSEFLWDIVPIFNAEIRALSDEGVDYIQIDAPRYSYYIDPKWRNYIQEEMGVDPEAALDEAIRVDNAAIEGARRDGVVLAVHLCRGNLRSQWYAEGGYDPIAEKLFNELNVDVFLLEYESERAGTFEPLRFVPRDKVVVLGLVSSKVAELESPDDLVARVEEASHYLPLENLALSPQCGFASSKDGNLLSEPEQWAKLELVVQVARRVWGDA